MSSRPFFNVRNDERDELAASLRRAGAVPAEIADALLQLEARQTAKAATDRLFARVLATSGKNRTSTEAGE